MPVAKVEPRAELRQLTVLFCDLVGSTELSETIDPEELREIVLAYQAAAGAVVERYEGHVAQYLGDGLLVYFGFPRAHEDDGRRAVHAGLEMAVAVADLGKKLPQLAGHELAVRVGIHTGEVVAGEVGSGETRERLALGPTPNIAARLQGLAEPGMVVVSDVTRRLVGGFFTCKSLGEKELKGVSRPVEVFEVHQASGVQSSFELSVARGLAPLLGRQAELETLQRALAEAKKGLGQTILVTGQAGIGKSRLLYQFRENVASDSLTWRIARCSAYHQNTALFPVVGLVREVLGLSVDDAAEKQVAKIEESLLDFEFEAAGTVPLLAALLSIPANGNYKPLAISPQQQKERTLKLLVDLIHRRATLAPVAVVFEDMHWADPSSLELAAMLLDATRSTHLLLLLTSRPDFVPPWEPSCFAQIDLQPLGLSHVAGMVEEITGGKRLPAQILQQITEKTDGVPLFVEELTKMVLESDMIREVEGRYELVVGRDGEGPALEIPSSVKDSLMARLDLLGPAKKTAQLCAVLGREFNHEVLSALSANETELRRHLALLVEREFLHLRKVQPRDTYIFKHALIQDAAYGSLLKRARRALHARTAEVIETRFPTIAQAQPEYLAHHCAEAGLRAQAIGYLQTAGFQAMQNGALVESANHFSRALKLLRAEPASSRRDRTELELLLPLGGALIATRGYGEEEVVRTFARAQQLCALIGETPLPVRFGIWAGTLMRGEVAPLAEMVEWYQGYLEGSTDPHGLLMVHAALCVWYFFRGDAARADEHIAETLERLNPDEHDAVVQQYLGSGGFYGHFIKIWRMALSGRYDQAQAHYERVLTQLESMGTPYALTECLTFGGVLAISRGEPQLAAAAGARTIDLASEHSFPWLLAVGRIACGWARARSGEVEEGISEMWESLAFLRAAGTQVHLPYYSTFLLEVLLDEGRTDEGSSLVEEALGLARTNVDCYYEAELLRLKAEFLVQRSAASGPEAEALLREAITIAERQDAWALALKAATSLARLTGRRAPLAEIHARLTEGLGTRDLRAAEALLADLA
jgi:class 3 adenylate cyclase/tetratricopeptide (TPR) repeat protein